MCLGRGFGLVGAGSCGSSRGQGQARLVFTALAEVVKGAVSWDGVWIGVAGVVWEFEGPRSCQTQIQPVWYARDVPLSRIHNCRCRRLRPVAPGAGVLSGDQGRTILQFAASPDLSSERGYC